MADGIENLSKQEKIEKIASSHYDAFKRSNEFHDEFTSKNNILNDVTNGYAGREILELLQNADDAYTKYINMGGSPESDVSVLFEYDDDILEVSNKGEPFDFDAFSSICDGYKSTKKDKYDESGYIGNKGIGFRSVLNWADSISIFSNGYNVGFSKEFAQEKFKELISNNDYIKGLCDKDPKLAYPIFSAPFWLESGCIKENYCTTIRLKLNGIDVQERINDFDAFSLLFMQRITSVRFKGKNSDIIYKKIERSEKDLRIIDIYENETLKRSFYFFSESLNNYILKKAFAIPVDFGEIENAKMYTFFPIQNNQSPFKALLHTTFSLDPTRNSITQIDENISISKELLEFYVKTVCTSFAKAEFGNRIVNLLMIHDEEAIKRIYPSRLDEILDFYKEKCKEYIRLFTVNGEFIEIKDKPVLNYKRVDASNAYEVEIGGALLGLCYPEHFKNANLHNRENQFSDLLSPLSIEENDFLKKMGITETYVLQRANFRDLKEVLEDMEPQCSVQENCESFVFWCEEFAKKQHANTKTLVWPKLLKTRDGKFARGKIFFQTSFDESFLDDFADIQVPVLGREYVLHLESIVENFFNIDVVIWNKLFAYHFRDDCFYQYNYYEISKYLKDKVGIGVNQTKSYVKWILNHYDLIKQDSSLKSEQFVADIIEQLPDINGQLRWKSDLYMSAELGNEVGANVFKSLPKYYEIAPLDFFDIDASQRESLKNLLINTRIYRFPPKMRSYTEPNWLRAFESLDTTLIVQWIKNDGVLEGEINKKESNFFGAEAKRIKWLKIGDEKFSPSQCLFIGSRETILPKFYPSCISEKWIRKVASGAELTPSDVKSLLLTLGMKESFKELESNDFYQLLMDLQSSEDDLGKSYLKQIYGDVADGDVNPMLLEDSNAKSKFKSDGLILTKDGSLLPHSEVYYANTLALNLAKDPLMNLQPRKNATTVKNVFFVEPFQERYKVESNENMRIWFKDAFLDDVKCWAVYVYCLRSRKKSDGDKATLKKFYKRICLIDHISVRFDNGEPIPISGGFQLVEDNDDEKWFICVGDVGDVSYEEFKSQNEVAFVEVLMQLLSSTLGLKDETVLRQYADLFVRKQNVRESILKAELNDNSQYEVARHDLYGETAETAELLQKLRDAQITIDDELEKLVKKLDFDKIESPGQEEIIRKILQKLGMNLSVFNKPFGMAFSLVHANAKLLEHAFNIRQRYCTLLIWKKLEQSTDEEKLRYNQHLDELQMAIKSEIVGLTDNSVEFDAADYVEQFLKARDLPVEHQEQNLEKEISVILKENKDALLKMSGEEQVNRFLSEGNNRSLLMFRQSSIKEKFSEWLENDKPEEPQISGGRETKELPKKIKEITSGDGEFTLDADSPAPPAIRIVRPRNGKGGGPNRKIVVEDPDENRDKGDSAELFIVDRLRENTIKAVKDFFAGEAYVVNWRSSASLRKENNVNCDDSVGYDIELVGKTKKLLVEVKTSSGKGVRFFISENEYKTLKKNENYLILYVPNNQVLDNPDAEVEYVPIWSKDIEKYNPKPYKYLVLEPLA